MHVRFYVWLINNLEKLNILVKIIKNNNNNSKISTTDE